MTIRYYMDVHVPATVTDGLRQRGIDILTAQEDGTREIPDDQLLSRAAELGRVLFSQDTDLLGVAHQWQTTGRAFAGLIFAHQQGSSIGQCVADLELFATCCDASEIENQVIFLPLR